MNLTDLKWVAQLALPGEFISLQRELEARPVHLSIRMITMVDGSVNNMAW